MKIQILEATDAEIKIVDDKLDEFNNSQVPFSLLKSVPQNYVIKEDGVIVAGISAVIYQYNIVYVYMLYVDEDFRGKGIGSALLQKVELEASKIGATLAHFDTFDFQAKDFYLKHGYEIFGTLDNCPTNHKRYYLKKVL